MQPQDHENPSFPRPSDVARDAILEPGDCRQLATRSSDLQQRHGTLAKLSFALLQSRDERQARRKVADEMTAQAERLLTEKLASDAESLQQEQDIRTQRQKRQQLIAHRQVMQSLGQRREDDLNDQCTSLFSEKKALLEHIGGIDGDESLKAFAAQCLGQITMASADNLHARNRRPK